MRALAVKVGESASAEWRQRGRVFDDGSDGEKKWVECR